ncbi:DUF968 domain-containing protein [Erwinia sp. SLM-02]|uniref:DUF968 domain-containing protein n=1 Tax=Erwinia sp. SLM-02 TaxID=3020057 RepID=UPI0030807949
MRAILMPFRVEQLGTVLLKPGSEAMPLFQSGRVLISTLPEFMQSMPSGRIVDVAQPLLDDPDVVMFLSSDEVISAAGGRDALVNWLTSQHQRHIGTGCQNTALDHSHGETILHVGKSAVRLCYQCDNRLREQESSPELEATARRNAAEWLLYRVQAGFQMPEGHHVTLPEVTLWASMNGVADKMPDALARRVLKLPPLPAPRGTMKEADIRHEPAAATELAEKAAQIVELAIDPETPESFMLRPKRRRWTNEKYTRWVKQQPCLCCGRQADDPHHLIGYGLGGMATKTHDLFVIPLCRAHHDELHADVGAFEEKYGTQPELLLRVLDRVLAIGVIATGKKILGEKNA